MVGRSFDGLDDRECDDEAHGWLFVFCLGSLLNIGPPFGADRRLDGDRIAPGWLAARSSVVPSSWRGMACRLPVILQAVGALRRSSQNIALRRRRRGTQ